MSDIQYNVRTVYETETKGSEKGLGNMGRLAGMAGGLLDGLKSTAATVFQGAMVGGIAAAGIGLAGLSYGIRHLNADVDSLSVGIAGMVSAAQVDGTEGPAGWASAMNYAESTLQQIRRDAAALPGEAEDFIEVFRAGLAPALNSGLEATDVSAFTNRFAAVGIAFRVDAPQIGRDLNLMLQGRAGAHVNMWNRLQSVIGKTAQQFNALSAAQRRMEIERAMQRYQPMIDAYSNTWEAISSTTVSYGKDLLRLATSPAFQLIKKELSSINHWWQEHEKYIHQVANGVGLSLVNAYKRAHGEAHRLYDVMNAWSAGPMGQRVLGFADRMRAGATAMVGGARNAGGWAMDHPAATASVAGAGIGLAMGMPGAGLAAGALVQFATHTTEANETVANLTGVGRGLWGTFTGLLPVVNGVEAFLGSILAGVLPGWSLGMSNLSTSVSEAVNRVGPALTGMLGALSPVFQILGVAVGGVANIIATGLGEALNAMARATAGLANMIKSVVTEMSGWLARHGITVQSTTNFLRESAATAYGSLSFLPRYFGTALGNFGRSIGVVDAHTPGAQRQNRYGAAGAGFFDESSAWDIFQRGYARAGGRMFAPQRPGAAAPTAPEHVQTIGERMEAAMTEFRTSMDRLRAPLIGAMQGNTLGAAANARNVGHPGRTSVTVHIHQTINTNDDPDRVLVMTRRGVHLGLFSPIESPGVRVTRGGP